MKTFSQNTQWEQRELKFEQPERTREQPEPNLGQPELRSGPFRLTFTTAPCTVLSPYSVFTLELNSRIVYTANIMQT